jgi:hypothetical protein
VAQVLADEPFREQIHFAQDEGAVEFRSTSGWLASWIFINDSSASAYSTLALSWFRASR